MSTTKLLKVTFKHELFTVIVIMSCTVVRVRQSSGKCRPPPPIYSRERFPPQNVLRTQGNGKRTLRTLATASLPNINAQVICRLVQFVDRQRVILQCWDPQAPIGAHPKLNLHFPTSLPHSEDCMILSSFIWIGYQRVTDRRTDGQTPTEFLQVLQRSALQVMRPRCKRCLPTHIVYIDRKMQIHCCDFLLKATAHRHNPIMLD